MILVVPIAPAVEFRNSSQSARNTGVGAESTVNPAVGTVPDTGWSVEPVERQPAPRRLADTCSGPIVLSPVSVNDSATTPLSCHQSVSTSSPYCSVNMPSGEEVSDGGVKTHVLSVPPVGVMPPTRPALNRYGASLKLSGPVAVAVMSTACL